jgi:glycosyltransferase involved in cell wall biosynthesis
MPFLEETPRRRLKLAFVHDGLYPYFKGGAERRFYEVARLLARRHDVTYFTWQYWQGPPVREEEGVRLRGVGPPMPFYGEDGKRTIGEALAFARRVVGALVRESFDVIDCCATPLPAVYLAWLATRWQRAPLVVTWHEFWGDYWRGYLAHRPLVARVAKTIEAGAVARADAIVAVSRFTAEKLHGRTAGVPVEVVENGVSLARIDAAVVAEDGPDVVFAGRLIDAKRVDVLIAAVARAVSQVPSIRCEVVGEGPERPRLEALASALGLADRVQFRGFLPEADLYGLMKSAKLFALPSVREGFGLGVIEAQACGAVPVVVQAPYNAATTLLKDGIDGAICEPSAVGVSDAIVRLLTNDAGRRRMATAARLSAQARDWSSVAQRTEAIYLDLAASRQGRIE